jgi:16S rRNA (uracil1498-N3)-methyltransferase
MSIKSHIFSFYVSTLSTLIENKRVGNNLLFRDSTLSHRLTRIIKLRDGDSFILFDDNIHALLNASSEMFSGKRIVAGSIRSISQNTFLKPEITLCVGLLRREAWDQVLYVAAQMGATRVVPLLTDRVQRSWGAEKEVARIEKIMVSAREQAKQFSAPIIERPISLEEFLKSEKSESVRICFEHEGKNLFEVLDDVRNKENKKIDLLFGPEGGLSKQELNFAIENGFTMCGLTPTVLRSIEAVTVGLGVARSLK